MARVVKKRKYELSCDRKMGARLGAAEIGKLIVKID